MSYSSTKTPTRRKSSNGSASSSLSEISTKPKNNNFEKDLINTLRRELYERGSPVGLMESPIKDRKQSLTSTISSDNLSNHFYKSFSTTNLSTKLRPNHERSLSSNSVSPKLLPKRPYKKALSSLNLPNMTPPKADDYFSSNMSPTMDNNERMDIDKKTLVDQFYSINETKPLKDDSLYNLEYTELDKHIQTDPELTNYLLNIDTIMKDVFSNSQEPENLSPILNTLQSVNHNLSEIKFQQDVSSLEDLNHLIKNLNNFEYSIIDLQNVLLENSTKVSEKYKPEIRNIVERLNDLLLSLDNLEFRLNKTKSLVKECKDVIGDDILKTIETLEYIDSRFKEFSKQTRKTRFKQLNIALAILVVLSGIYFSIYR
ncbi:hypothetical protein CLIB1444_01S04434 [[Candida] jaroonii]|uniref:Uncharacterized protein n=1 Tax=[Candida] jaroonii TaxID=467808 RepID=A0ACA9Y0A2_9ASCO|nr:hypothetical protein CLIB1444_01S04434 [[Candida] jaroonii]